MFYWNIQYEIQKIRDLSTVLNIYYLDNSSYGIKISYNH